MSETLTKLQDRTLSALERNAEVSVQLVSAIKEEQRSSEAMTKAVIEAMHEQTDVIARHAQEDREGHKNTSEAVQRYALAIEARTTVYKEIWDKIATTIEKRWFSIVVSFSAGLGLQGAWRLLQVIIESMAK